MKSQFAAILFGAAVLLLMLPVSSCTTSFRHSNATADKSGQSVCMSYGAIGDRHTHLVVRVANVGEKIDSNRTLGVHEEEVIVSEDQCRHLQRLILDTLSLKQLSKDSSFSGQTGTFVVNGQILRFDLKELPRFWRVLRQATSK